MTTAAIEDYLKSIYLLSSQSDTVTTSALAASMHVSAASTTNMVKKLAKSKLVRHSPYRGVELTRAGEKIALEVIRHHRLVELFLQQTLGLPWDQVHAEADKLEHVLSDQLEDRIATMLGDPVTDPHGDPIPDKEGRMVLPEVQALADLPVGETGIVRRVADQAPEHLRYLGNLGLVPNARVYKLEQMPFKGPVRIRVGQNEHVLDDQFACAILVSPLSQKPARRGKSS